jgi:hypothetical protein
MPTEEVDPSTFTEFDLHACKWTKCLNSPSSFAKSAKDRVAKEVKKANKKTQQRSKERAQKYAFCNSE